MTPISQHCRGFHVPASAARVYKVHELDQLESQEPVAPIDRIADRVSSITLRWVKAQTYHYFEFNYITLFVPM